jgi:beta-carotene 3-hydroxylase
MIFGIGFITAFLLMELCAWLAHKYIMHGFLWSIHEGHHQPTGSAFQKNDLFFLIFAIPSWLAIMFGVMQGVYGLTGIGFGIATYGVAYFLVHDILIHRRFNWLDKVQNRYFNAVRRAHRVHHEKRFKEGSESFGMLYIPRKFYKE